MLSWAISWWLGFENGYGKQHTYIHTSKAQGTERQVRTVIGEGRPYTWQALSIIEKTRPMAEEDTT